MVVMGSCPSAFSGVEKPNIFRQHMSIEHYDNYGKYSEALSQKGEIK
jgi:hypothetical protein